MASKIPPSVILAAKASHLKWKIPASVSLAQWAVESGWGKHYSGNNNPFGIKSSKGRVVSTDEQHPDGTWYTIKAGFKNYPSIDAAFDDHGRLLATAAPYAKARLCLPDPIKFCHALTGVYATALAYGDTLEQIINGSEKLRQYDT